MMNHYTSNKGNYALLFFLFLFSNPVENRAQALKIQHDLVVAKDGSGDYRYIQDAIDAIRVYLPKSITVRIKKGIYKEKIVVPSTLTNVTFLGDNRDSTVISYDDFSGKGKMETFDSYTVKVMGNDIMFKNLTIENTAGRVGQAVALHVEGDRCTFENCRLLGNQDTLFASGENARQYFLNCYIEGTVDFIFGSATAFFDHCQIHSKTSGSYITAASTPKWVFFGYIFKDCKLTAAIDVEKVYLGRPWRDYAKTVFINCDMGNHIIDIGWNNWSRPETEKTSFYAEYKCSGAGFKPEKRAKWAHQLTDKEAGNYTIESVFSGKLNAEFIDFWHR
jgi:pectinesterase